MASGGISTLAGNGMTFVRSGSDNTNYSLNNLPPELALQAEQIQRRQHIADSLVQQSLQPRQGMMAGRFFVGPGLGQGIAQLGQAAIGAYMSNKNHAALKDIGQQHQSHMADALQKYIKGTSDTPAQPGAPVAVGKQIDLGGMVNTPGGGAAFSNQSGMQPVTPTGTPQQRTDHIDTILGQGYAPEGHADMVDAVRMRNAVHQQAGQMYPETPQGPANPNMSPVMAPGAEVPSRPRTPQEIQAALAELMSSGHPYAPFLAKQQQDAQHLQSIEASQTAEHNRQREFTHGENQAKIASDLMLGMSKIDMDVKLGVMTRQMGDELKRDLATNAETLKRDMATQEDKRARDLARERNETQLRGDKILADAKKEAAATGKTPPGYRSTKDGNLEAIPGGPADQKLQGALNQDTSMLQSSTASMDRLATTANELLNHKGLASITGLRGAIPNIPGTNAADAQAQLDSLKSKVGFNVLQEMRNNSKSGGALGAISDKENVLLQNNLEALDKAQSYEAMQKALQGIIKYSDDAKSRLQNAYNLKHKGGNAVPAPSPSAPSVESLLEKYK